MTAASEGATDETAIRQAEREAVDWLVLLQDDPGDREVRAGLETWLAASSVRATAWADIQLTAGLIDVVPPARREVWASWRDDRLRGQASGMRRRSSRIRPPVATKINTRAGRALVAGLAAAVCLAVLVAPEVSIRFQADYASGAGEQRVVQLQDGSEMRLAPRSAVKLAYADGRRGVSLLRGQAYFEVLPDPGRQFVVDAGDVRTTVLGTGFDVVRRSGGADVAVRHGLVRVDRSKADAPVSARLSAGDRITVTEQRADMHRESPERVGAWTQGDLIVADQSVLEVVEALRPWRKGVILTAGVGLESKRVTGVYDLHDPQAALAALAKVHDLRIREITPWITVVSAS